jgi:signal transduction histidine kinase
MIVYKQKVRQKELLALKTEEMNRQQTLDMLMTFELKNIRASIEGQEIERKRIAQELHDGIGGSLAGIKMRMQSLTKKGEVNDQFKNVIQSIDDVYREVRTLSHHLTPPGMHRHSFVEFISKYLNDISEASKFELEYIFHGEEELNSLPDESKVEIYRILQELINNIIKHAEANFVEVQLLWSEDCVNLIVEDLGKGFNPASVKSGIGLNSIAKRVESMGGKLNIDSNPGRGTIINVDIYCNPTKMNIA